MSLVLCDYNQAFVGQVEVAVLKAITEGSLRTLMLL